MELITAAEARAKVNKGEFEKAQIELESVKNQIHAAVTQGKVAINVGKALLPATVGILKAKGYKYEVGYDQRDGDSWHTISW